jgi:hypothetical protein
MGYRVLINDNFHYRDESERVKHGVFATPDEADSAWLVGGKAPSPPARGARIG